MDHRPKCKMQNYKLLGDNIGENLGDLGFGDDFLDVTPKAQFRKEKIGKWNFIKIKNFCSEKDTVKKMRR